MTCTLASRTCAMQGLCRGSFPVTCFRHLCYAGAVQGLIPCNLIQAPMLFRCGDGARTLQPASGTYAVQVQ